MANLDGKLSQVGDIIIYTQANTYFNALNSKMSAAIGKTITLKKSYMSKYDVADDLRSKLREDYRSSKPSNINVSDSDFETIKPLLDLSKTMLEIATTESDYNKLESYLNTLATTAKGAFDPPLGNPFNVDGQQVYPIPQNTEEDPRRHARILQSDLFEKAVLDWLIDNALLYGFTLYENYGLYYIGLKQIQQKTQTQTDINKLVNRFQKTPIPAGDINITVNTLAQAKDPVVGDLDIVTTSAPVYDNDGNPFTQLALVPGGQITRTETAAAAIILINAAKAEGINLSVASGFRPAVDKGQRITWVSSSGKTGKLTTQESLRRDSSRFVKSHADYKKFIDGNGSASSTTFGSKTGKEAFIFYAGSSAYNAATAPPGKSNHGNGIALDFAIGGRKNFSPLKEDKYIWLAKNAHKYGFVRAVSSEEWHWEYRPEEAKKGPYARVKPGSGGGLVNNGWYPDLGLDKLTT